MLVLVLSACPLGLRGYLTRWLIEVSAGVFVGRVSVRVREAIWARTTEQVRTGRAILVFSTRSEQGFSFRSHGHHWEPIDIDGITLMLRPLPRADGGGASATPGKQGATGWSKAAHRRR